MLIHRIENPEKEIIKPSFWKGAEKCQSKSYIWSTVYAMRKNKDLLFKFKSKWHSDVFMVIENFENYTAAEVLYDIAINQEGSQPYNLGKNFNDLLLAQYKKYGLRLGYKVN